MIVVQCEREAERADYRAWLREVRELLASCGWTGHELEQRVFELHALRDTGRRVTT